MATPDPLATLLCSLGPLRDIQIKNGIDPKILAGIINFALPDMGLGELSDIHRAATSVLDDLKRQNERVTLGQLLGHKAVVEFFAKHSTTPVWRILKCPSCQRVVERNTRSPRPCPCGYDWAAEKADLLAYAQKSAKPGRLLEQFELLRKEPHD